MADSIISLHLARRGLEPATAAARFLRSGIGARDAMAALIDEFEGVQSGARDGRFVVRIDKSTRAQATQTITMAQASCTAGDKILITVPGFPAYVLTAVAGSATTADGEYSIDTSDTAVAASVAAAINAVPGLKEQLSAESAAGVVTVTALAAGSAANSIALGKAVTTGAAVTFGASTLSGGADAGDKADVTVTFGSADITANDTITIGSVVFTWVASSANENEITLSTTEATAADNFVAAVNAHSKLQGLIEATEDSSTVVRLTYHGDPRAGELVPISRTETNSGSITLSAALFGSGATEAYGADPLTFTLGAP